MNEIKQNDGCDVCKHRETCGSNPFGICKDFVEMEKRDE